MDSLNANQIISLTATLEQLLTDLREQVELASPAASTVVLDQRDPVAEETLPYV